MHTKPTPPKATAYEAICEKYVDNKKRDHLKHKNTQMCLMPKSIEV